ncbi:MAG TPA: IMP cyclohydrolase, partial [Dehalococcoidales bacterium]
MKNPDGPYPGRQLFLGLTAMSQPCFAYVVTGRSAPTRERKAVQSGNIISMGPIGNVPYDPLRHYSAVKYDSASGILAVTNGIQTEAVYEVYKLLFNVDSARGVDYMEKIMDGANAEIDSYYTPRIAGIIVPGEDKSGMKFIAGIKTFGRPAKAYQLAREAGILQGISTYKGDLLKPEARDPAAPLSRIEFRGKTGQELAEF